MVREILVVKRDVLFKDNFFTGYVPVDNTNFLDVILNNFEYRERNDELEHDMNYKQIVSYILIVNPVSKKIFAYRRATDQNYNEKRLRNKWSCGIGGHIDKDTEGDSENPIKDGIMRELMEEVKMNNYSVPTIIGLVTLDNKMIEHYHVGVVCILETGENVEKNDDEMAEGWFMSIEEVEKLFSDTSNEIELFTQLSWNFIKDYLTKL